MKKMRRHYRVPPKRLHEDVARAFTFLIITPPLPLPSLYRQESGKKAIDTM